MEEDASRNDIRRLLKTFGIQADEAIVTHLALTSADPLRLRLSLTDLTDYGNNPPEHLLHLEIEGDVRR